MRPQPINIGYAIATAAGRSDEYVFTYSCQSAGDISPVRDNYNIKSHKYVCITTYKPDTKSNTNPDQNTNAVGITLLLNSIQ